MELKIFSAILNYKNNHASSSGSLTRESQTPRCHRLRGGKLLTSGIPDIFFFLRYPTVSNFKKIPNTSSCIIFLLSAIDDNNNDAGARLCCTVQYAPINMYFMINNISLITFLLQTKKNIQKYPYIRSWAEYVCIVSAYVTKKKWSFIPGTILGCCFIWRERSVHLI